MKHRLLFGPVPSRRLGLSLGVDLVPYKVCSMDCVYCECGKTTETTLERQEFFPFEEVCGELDEYLQDRPKLDFITLTGSGEPTLNINLGRIITYLKTHYPQYKICVITNSTLMAREDVRQEILPADLVMPSLDGGTQKAFRAITRPAGKLNFAEMVEGLIQFSNEYKGELWLEVFVVGGVNDSIEAMKDIAEIAKKMVPTRIQLNSLDRPGTESWVNKPSYEKMQQLVKVFYPLRVEIISKYENRKMDTVSDDHLTDKVVEILRRRPCTLDDLHQSTGASCEQVNESLRYLMGEGLIVSRYQERGLFYFLKNP